MQPQWIIAVWYLNLAATIALIAKLVRSSLYRTYVFFFVYLMANAAQSIGGLFLKNHRKPCSWLYVISQPLKAVLAGFVILELYRIALEERPALARFARNTVAYALGVAAIAALCFMTLDSAISEGQSPVLHRVNSFERTMDLGMLDFLVLISVVMAWFPVRVTRNGGLYIVGFAVYFLSRATGLLLTNLTPHSRERFDLAMLVVSFLCLATWLLKLRREGEEATVLTGPRRDPAAIAQLTWKLDALNERLVELSRR